MVLLMDEIAAPPATEKMRPFSQLVASFGGGQVVQNVTRSVSRVFPSQMDTVAASGKVPGGTSSRR